MKKAKKSKKQKPCEIVYHPKGSITVRSSQECKTHRTWSYKDGEQWSAAPAPCQAAMDAARAA